VTVIFVEIRSRHADDTLSRKKKEVTVESSCHSHTGIRFIDRNTLFGLTLHTIMRIEKVLPVVLFATTSFQSEAFSRTIPGGTYKCQSRLPSPLPPPSSVITKKNVSLRVKIGATLVGGEGYPNDFHGRRRRYHDVSFLTIKEKVKDLTYGASYVNDRFLELFWEYNVSRLFLPFLLPLTIILVGSRVVSADIGSITFDVVKSICTSMFLVSGIVGGILQLPFDAMRWFLSWTPALVVPLLSYLPSNLAMKLVQIVLDLRSGFSDLGRATISTGLAVLFWRPMLEELQYRYLLGTVTGPRRRRIPESAGERTFDQTSTLVRHLLVDGTVMETQQKIDDSNGDTGKASRLRTTSSRRKFVTTVAFAATRLGWLYASPGSLNLSYPFIQAATSPYAWTVAFVQSVTAHFSSLSLSELSPFLQRSLLLFAIQQMMSTFLITWHVFIPLYEERGIGASIGAHIAWTVGMMTWPIRLIRRAFLSRDDSRVSY